MSREPFHLFERFGVELEYIIVDRDTLRVRPWADRLMLRECGDVSGDVERGSIAWSNELALHVIEFKTARPARTMDGLAARFQREVRHVNDLLAEENACLLPTGMHPWMNPRRESRLWPHECGEIYQAFHRIFDCRGHGWTNLQSAHVNLPFRGDAEFGRLHAAVRVLLPLLPALAASSPFVDGRRGPFLDMRLDAYRRNCARVPAVTGLIVPERVATAGEYRERILGRIHRAMRPLDPEGVLRHEWVNARGAIARFERGSIEIRVLDLQECPAADLAILQFITAVLRRMTERGGDARDAQSRPGTAALASLMERVIRDGRAARVGSRAVLPALGLEPGRSDPTVGEVWRRLLDDVAPGGAGWRVWIRRILEQGSLSERIVRATGDRPGRARLRAVYARLAECLARGEGFEA